MNPLPHLLLSSLVLATVVATGGCQTDPAVPLWDGANEEDALLYQQAAALGLATHPDIQKMMVTTLLHERVYSELEAGTGDEAKLKEYFEAHRESFATPARVHLLRILLPPFEEVRGPALEAKARRLHSELTASTDRFAALARQHSRGPYREQGGDVGFITAEGKGGVDAAIVSFAFEATPGGPPALLETEEGWNIVWVTEAAERFEPDFEAVRHTVARRFNAVRQRALYSAYIDELKAAKGAP
jgi:peptidyl-prolyl cis-trans isomerase C